MEYDISPSEAVSVAVVMAVSSAENCQPSSLPPLHDFVDTDALEGLFPPSSEGDPGRCGSVSFVFSDSHVTVDDQRHISIDPDTDAPVHRSLEN